MTRPWSHVLVPVLLGGVAGGLAAYDHLLAGALGPDFTEFRLWPGTLTLALLLCAAVLAVALVRLPSATKALMREKERLAVVLLIFGIHCTAVALGVLDPSEVVVALFTLVLLVAVLGPDPHHFIATPVNVLNGLILLAMILSLPSDLNPLSLLKGLKAFFVFFLLVNFIYRRNLEQTFVDWLLITGLLFGLFAYVQAAAWIFAQLPLTLLDDAALRNSMEETPFGPMLRVPGMTLSYRAFAMILAVSISLALTRLQYVPDLSTSRRRLTMASLAVMLPAVLLTVAKDVLLGLTFALPMLLVLRKPARLVGAAMLVLVLSLAGTLALVILPENVDRIASLTREIPKAEQERIRLDREGLEWLLHGPYDVFGRGVGSGNRYTSHVRGWPAHNSIILAADEIGYLGVCAMLAIYAWIAWRVLVLNAIARAPPDIALARGFAASLLVIFVGIQFEASYVDTFMWSFFALVEATALRVIPRYRADGTRLLPTRAATREAAG